MTAAEDNLAGVPVGSAPAAEPVPARAHPAGAGQAPGQQPTRTAVTPGQQRARNALAIAVLVIFFGGLWTLLALTDHSFWASALPAICGGALTWVLTPVVARARRAHIAIAQHAEDVYSQACSQDPGSKALARGLARTVRMRSESAQARRRAWYALPAMGVIFGVVILGAIAGAEHGFAAFAWAVEAQVLALGAIRAATRVAPARRLPASVRDSLRADLWHLAVGWLTIAAMTAMLLAILSVIALTGGGPVVWIPLLGLAAATSAAAYLLLRWIRAAPLTAANAAATRISPGNKSAPG